MHSIHALHNKAVIDRRLRPRCCHLGSYSERPKSSPVRPFACTVQLVLLRTVYSQAQGCVCTALQLVGGVDQPRLMSKYDVIHKKPEVHNVSLCRVMTIGNMHKNSVKIGDAVPKI